MSDPVLELRDVHAAYGPFRALFGVDVAVEPGQVTALVGPNGSGKTTVARVASGLLAPSSGRVSLAGVDMTDRPAWAFARDGVAHAPEGRSVFASLTVAENLELAFRQAHGRGGSQPLLAEAYELFPRLGERRTQLAGSLSGGEQRMLSLARVLVDPPSVLVVDELSLGLAPVIVDEVYAKLALVGARGTALLLIEQSVDRALALADSIVVLRGGTVAYAGTPIAAARIAELFLRDGGDGGAVAPDGAGT